MTFLILSKWVLSIKKSGRFCLSPLAKKRVSLSSGMGLLSSLSLLDRIKLSAWFSSARLGPIPPNSYTIYELDFRPGIALKASNGGADTLITAIAYHRHTIFPPASHDSTSYLEFKSIEGGSLVFPLVTDSDILSVNSLFFFEVYSRFLEVRFQVSDLHFLSSQFQELVQHQVLAPFLKFLDPVLTQMGHETKSLVTKRVLSLKSCDPYDLQAALQALIIPESTPNSVQNNFFKLLFQLRPKLETKSWGLWVHLLSGLQKKLTTLITDRSDMDWSAIMDLPEQCQFYEPIHTEIASVVSQLLPDLFVNRTGPINLCNFGCGKASELRQVALSHLEQGSPNHRLVIHLFDREAGLLKHATTWANELNEKNSHKLFISVDNMDLETQRPDIPIDLFVASGLFNHQVLEKNTALEMLKAFINCMSMGGIGIVTGLSPSWVTKQFLEENGCEVQRMITRDSKGEPIPFYVFKKIQ